MGTRAGRDKWGPSGRWGSSKGGDEVLHRIGSRVLTMQALVDGVEGAGGADGS